MKQIMQIIGAKNMGAGTRPDSMDSVMEVYCIPFTTENVKIKKPSLMSIAMGEGLDMQQLMGEAQAMKKHVTIFYVTLETWLNEFKNKLLTKIELEISCTQYMEEK
jgi:hypothetical protein